MTGLITLSFFLSTGSCTRLESSALAERWQLRLGGCWTTMKTSPRKLCHLYSLLGGCRTVDWKENLQTSRAISEIRRQRKKQFISKKWIFHLHTFSFLLHSETQHFSLIYRFIVKNWWRVNFSRVHFRMIIVFHKYFFKVRMMLRRVTTCCLYSKQQQQQL